MFICFAYPCPGCCAVDLCFKIECQEQLKAGGVILDPAFLQVLNFLSSVRKCDIISVSSWQQHVLIIKSMILSSLLFNVLFYRDMPNRTDLILSVQNKPFLITAKLSIQSITRTYYQISLWKISNFIYFKLTIEFRFD